MHALCRAESLRHRFAADEADPDSVMREMIGNRGGGRGGLARVVQAG